MRIALEVVAVLEGARLALVDVHRHQARRGLGAHDLPLAPGREARAAEAAQARVLHRLRQALQRRARRRGSAAGRGNRRWRDIRHRRCACPDRCRTALAGDQPLHGVHGRVPHRVLPDHRHRRGLAAADAGRVQHAHVAPRMPGSSASSCRAPAIVAGERIAHAHRERRRGRAAFLDHVEVVIERRDLVHLGQRQLHRRRQRHEVRGRELAVVILDAVQMLDQEIAPAWLGGEQRLHLGERLGIGRAALDRGACLDLPNGDGRADVHSDFPAAGRMISTVFVHGF